MADGAIVTLARNLKTCAQECWPDDRIKSLGLPEFKPPGDISPGDISTDFCIRLAAHLKLGTDEIARQLFARVDLSAVSQFTVENGFVNLRLTDHALWEMRNDSGMAQTMGSQPHRFSIVVPPPCQALEGMSYLRLALGGLKQFLALRETGYQSEFVVGLDCLIGFDLHPDPAAAVRMVIGRVAEIGLDRLEVGLDQALERAVSGAVFLWIYPPHIDQKRFRSFSRLAGKAEHPLLLRCPARNWLYPFDEGNSAEGLNTAGNATLENILNYLALPIPAEEIDLGIVNEPGRYNLAWSIENTRRRVASVTGKPLSDWLAAGDPVAVDPKMDPVERDLLLRLVLFADYRLRAALRGEVHEMAQAFFQILSGVNALLNRPQFRTGLYRHDPLAAQILAGLNGVLSSRIPS